MSFAIVGGVLTVGGGFLGMGSAKRAARDAKIEKELRIEKKQDFKLN